MSNTAPHQETLWGQPKGLYVLFLTEMWERFSYYGMRALLTLYLVANVDDGGFGWSLPEALALYGTYTMMVYVASVPGGFIADRLLGQKKCVMIGGLFLCVGHGVMAMQGMTPFYTALTLIVIGVGLLKPNISTMVGGLYGTGDARRDKGFSIFYMGINVGALASAIIVGAVGESEKWGWHYGFALAGIGMVFGQLVFMYGQKYLTEVGNFVSSSDKTAQAKDHAPLTKIERDRIFVLLVAFMIVLVFWGAFEQAGGLMSIYTDTKVDRNFAGIEFPASTFQSLNPLFIILFATTVAGYWHRRLVRGKQASATFKMAIGTMIMGFGFVFMVLAAQEGAPKEEFGRRVETVVLEAGGPSEETTFWESAQVVNEEYRGYRKLNRHLSISAEADRILAGADDAAELRPSVHEGLTAIANSTTEYLAKSKEARDNAVKAIAEASYDAAGQGELGQRVETAVLEAGSPSKESTFWKVIQEGNKKLDASKASEIGQLADAEAVRILADTDDAAELRPPIIAGLTSIAGSTTEYFSVSEESRDTAVEAVAEASYASAVRASTAMFWLILAYLFHTIGELCSSPVALSFITKLTPARYASIMMGTYFAVTGLGNKLAGKIGEQAENFSEFAIFSGIMIFTVVFCGILLVFLKPLNRLTHGAEEISDGDED